MRMCRKPNGLKSKIPLGKRVLGDQGYLGEPETITTRNSLDAEAVKKLKQRAMARQETFNSRIKDFKILSECFRHGVEKHQVVFEAICVLVLHELENGHPLFDVWVVQEGLTD
jgi:hypothetical protein